MLQRRQIIDHALCGWPLLLAALSITSLGCTNLMASRGNRVPHNAGTISSAVATSQPVPALQARPATSTNLSEDQMLATEVLLLSKQVASLCKIAKNCTPKHIEDSEGVASSKESLIEFKQEIPKLRAKSRKLDLRIASMPKRDSKELMSLQNAVRQGLNTVEAISGRGLDLCKAYEEREVVANELDALLKMAYDDLNFGLQNSTLNLIGRKRLHIESLNKMVGFPLIILFLESDKPNEALVLLAATESKVQQRWGLPIQD